MYFQNLNISTSDEYNISHSQSSSTSFVPLFVNDSLRMYHSYYVCLTSFNVSSYSFLASDQPQMSVDVISKTKQNLSSDNYTSVEFPSIVSIVRIFDSSDREQIDLNNIQEKEILSSSSSVLPSMLESVIKDRHLTNSNSITQTRSNRMKSASAVRSRHVIGSNSTKTEQRRSVSTTKKRNQYYRECVLSPEEVELREALRIIDLDNIGFFSPNEFRKALGEIGINSNDIEKLARCLPLDEDGHYSIDNLVELLLNTNKPE